MENQKKTISKEGVLVVIEGSEPIAIVRRDEVSRHQVVYRLVECGAEDFEQLINNKNE